MSDTAGQVSDLSPLPKPSRVSVDLRRILHNAGWMMGEQVIRMLTAIFVSVWVARHLGPAQFGLLSYSQAFAALFAVVAVLGLSRIVVRELVETQDQAARQAVVVVTVFVFRLIAAVVLYGSAISLMAWNQDPQRTILVALVGVSILASPFDCADLYFQSQSRSRVSVLARSAAFFVSTGVKIALLLMGAGLMEFALAVGLEYVLNGAALYLAYSRNGLSLRVAPDWGLGRRLLRESWPDIISAFSVLFFMRSGQLMLESMRGAGEVGIYSAAARLSEAWYFIPVSLVASYFPKIVQSRSDSEAYYSQISRLLVVLVLISYVAGLAATLLSGHVVGWLYGAAYSGSAAVLCIHIWCGLLVGFAQVSGAWLLAERRIVLNLQRNLFGLVANIILNLVLIPRFGALGAAWATLLAMISAYYLFDILNPAARKMFFIKTRALFLMKSP